MSIKEISLGRKNISNSDKELKPKELDILSLFHGVVMKSDVMHPNKSQIIFLFGKNVDPENASDITIFKNNSEFIQYAKIWKWIIDSATYNQSKRELVFKNGAVVKKWIAGVKRSLSKYCDEFSFYIPLATEALNANAASKTPIMRLKFKESGDILEFATWKDVQTYGRLIWRFRKNLDTYRG